MSSFPGEKKKREREKDQRKRGGEKGKKWEKDIWGYGNEAEDVI